MHQDTANKGWWSRNWKWAVPAGCVTLCVFWIVAISALIYGMFFLMKTADVYEQALQEVKNNPQVIASIGSPVKDGWYMTGTIKTSGSGGEADISFPVSGPQGSGKVYAVAEKSAGKWTFTTLVFEDERGERIYLAGEELLKEQI